MRAYLRWRTSCANASAPHTATSTCRRGGSARWSTRARVVSVKARVTPYQKIPLVEATLESGDAVASAVWFHQPFLKGKLFEGMELVLSGRVQRKGSSLQFQNPEYEVAHREQLHVGALAPVYPEPRKLSSRWLRSLIEPVLYLADQVEDTLPQQV